jgi:hypothetical protein
MKRKGISSTVAVVALLAANETGSFGRCLSRSATKGEANHCDFAP